MACTGFCFFQWDPLGLVWVKDASTCSAGCTCPDVSGIIPSGLNDPVLMAKCVASAADKPTTYVLYTKILDVTT